MVQILASWASTTLLALTAPASTRAVADGATSVCSFIYRPVIRLISAFTRGLLIFENSFCLLIGHANPRLLLLSRSQVLLTDIG